ncbi:MAG: hypothetical protein Q4F84_01520 [Fibrobacter sp.]|nr:hypothetical protein [Fibrobacter sp.]
MEKKLLHIKCLYETVLEITANFLNNFDEESAEETFKKRTALLSLIATEEDALKEQYGTLLKAKFPRIINEIANKINAIITMDKQIAGKFREKMASIKSELSGLFTNSHAVAAYSFHQKR